MARRTLRDLIKTSRNLHFPDAQMQDGVGTLVTNPNGSQSSRAPSPQQWADYYEATGEKGERANTLESVRAEARLYGIDPDKYGADYETLHSDVQREQPRMAAMLEHYTDEPATWRYDDAKQEYVPESYRFVPKESTRAKNEAYKHMVRAKEDRRAISDRFKGRIGPQYQAKLNRMAMAGDRAGLRAEKDELIANQRDDANKNIADAAKNRHISRNLNSPDLAPGFIYRSTQGVTPHDRAALYTVLGWEPAATRETQAGIAQDAYNTQAAIASQQGGDAAENPDDSTIAGQTNRHLAMIDRMLQSAEPDDINRAVNAATNFHRQANELPLPEAQARANEEVADMLIRRGGTYASTPQARARVADKAKGTRDQFVVWASTVGWSPEFADAEYDRLRGKSRPTPPDAASASTAGLPPPAEL